MASFTQVGASFNVPSGFPSPVSAPNRGYSGQPSISQSPQIAGALQLSGLHPQQLYPSPQETTSPLAPQRGSNDALDQSSPKQNGAAPTVLVNGHKPKDGSGSKAGSAEEDFGEDDGWIDSAIAEMNDVEGESIIACRLTFPSCWQA